MISHTKAILLATLCGRALENCCIFGQPFIGLKKEIQHQTLVAWENDLNGNGLYALHTQVFECITSMFNIGQKQV